jgi:hypothetical protein
MPVDRILLRLLYHMFPVGLLATTGVLEGCQTATSTRTAVAPEMPLQNQDSCVKSVVYWYRGLMTLARESNVRAAPDDLSPVIATLQKGSIVHIDIDSFKKDSNIFAGHWALVHNKTNGCVISGWVRISDLN